MANTTNFGWETPDDTDLVKDGASAMRTLGNAIDTSLVDLKGGTTGQVLSKASNTDMDFTWVAQDDSNAIQNAIVDAKGDLISATAADTPARLAVGTDGQVLTADSTTATGLKWATASAGITWTPRLGATNAPFYCVAYNGSNLYVAAGSAGQLYTSSDGKTWTSRTSGFGANDIRDVFFGNGLWVAVGGNGTLTTSTDGITWTARTANVGTNLIFAVTYANSLWVAACAGGGTANTGGIIYSSDGITWTRKSQSITSGTNYNCVVWNGTNWIVGTNFSTNNYLYASTPSGTWTAGHTGTSADIYKIFWDGTRHTTLESTSGIPYYSTSTTLGTTAILRGVPRSSSNIIDYQTANYYYNNKVYINNTTHIQSFTTISSNNPLVDGSTPLPVRLAINGQIDTNGAAIWVGAAGIIITGGFGQIWTSF